MSDLGESHYRPGAELDKKHDRYFRGDHLKDRRVKKVILGGSIADTEAMDTIAPVDKRSTFMKNVLNPLFYYMRGS